MCVWILKTAGWNLKSACCARLSLFYYRNSSTRDAHLHLTTWGRHEHINFIYRAALWATSPAFHRFIWPNYSHTIYTEVKSSLQPIHLWWQNCQEHLILVYLLWGKTNILWAIIEEMIHEPKEVQDASVSWNMASNYGYWLMFHMSCSNTQTLKWHSSFSVFKFHIHIKTVNITLVWRQV